MIYYIYYITCAIVITLGFIWLFWVADFDEDENIEKIREGILETAKLLDYGVKKSYFARSRNFYFMTNYYNITTNSYGAIEEVQRSPYDKPIKMNRAEKLYLQKRVARYF